MNKIRLFILVLLIAACGNPENESDIVSGFDASNSKHKNVVLTYQDHALAIRDSAMRIALSTNDDSEIKESLRLLDKAMDLDPQSKNIFYSKMKILSDHHMREEVFEMLKRLDTLEFNTAYSTLHLAIEYELHNDMEMANKKYRQAATDFYHTLTTQRDLEVLDRSNMLLTMAVAERLGKIPDKKAEGLLSSRDKLQLDNILNDIAKVERSRLLESNRLKLKLEEKNNP